MKTSNKLLLGFAALLIIIPMIVLAINVKVNYIAETNKTYLSRQELNNEPFNKKTIGRIAIPISKPFNSINFADAKMIATEINLSKSENYGVKIPEEMKEYFSFNVDKNGVLNISLKENLHDIVDIVIYSPNYKNLTIANASLVQVYAMSDSLQISLTNINSFSFGGAIYFNDDKGKIFRTLNQSEVNNLSVNLNNSIFINHSTSFQDLTITAKGNSQIALIGDENEKEKYSVNKLIINTTDTANVSVTNMLIKNCSGKISDHTKLEMPVINLKQLFKE